jgi:hypothetical protein
VPGKAPAASDDLRFINTGAKAIPAGAPVRWQVKQLNQSGVFALPQALVPGASIDAAALLRETLPGGTRCLVHVG